MNTEEKYAKFTKDCEKAGMKVEQYNGRNFYKGPAVRCDSIQDVVSKTKVPCQWDNMGLGFIVYPK